LVVAAFFAVSFLGYQTFKAAAPKPTTLAEARQQVSFPLFVPAEWGPPTKVEHANQFGTQMVTLHFERAGQKIRLQEIPIAQAMPLEQAKALQGSKAVPLKDGREGVHLNSPLVGGNSFTWQDPEAGVDFTLIGEGLTEAEFVAIAQSMKRLER
jgi:hypothetical protein